MSDESDWSIPPVLRPRPELCDFDLERALEAVVSLRAQVPEDAFTAPILGTEREGSAVLLEGGRLAVTIGYLVAEAERVWLGSERGAVEAHLLGYDFVTGFGVLLLLGRLPVAGLALGSGAALRLGDPVILAASGGPSAAVQARLLARHEFAGYWEYLLEEAYFTAPAHPHWGGAGLIGPDGKLVGVGSLLIEAEAGPGRPAAANMVVPTDILVPILDQLVRKGRVDRPPRPWLGLYVVEAGDRLVVSGVAPGGPAHKAGVERGDLVVAVAGRAVVDLADLWRKVWALGEAGIEVPLMLVRNGRRIDRVLRSIDREQMLRRPRLH
ncbi:MAG: S1C family serine protease [Geminicoccaceae bacterium]|nr:S1C family serine protease [Geminicoccaceae bacterium]MCS7268048.1 S1C family serine protease [Geminicoccaceae bacterium]MCX7631560.1 S1C family serine protease [Geminicoccaceae bacterium]MDW8124759.1 S1C family serine protease [Geminicoccaceae bacterium]MDW8341426.1 S1C family serine protease [Geminicoccaceae bacterium]